MSVRVSHSRSLASRRATQPAGFTPTNYNILLCPSDTTSWRARGGSSGYPFSYAMNWMACSYSYMKIQIPDKKLHGQVTDMTDTSATIVILEEDENTIDDGQASIWEPNGIEGNWSEVNLLAIRHDAARSYPDNPTTGLLINGNRRGNVGFVDGHGEYITRWECSSKTHAVPVPTDFPNDPETEPPGP